MTWLAGTVVVAAGLYLIGLAALAVFAPVRAKRFLEGFASSARAHYLEQALRLVVGGGLVLFAAEMKFSYLFRIFGWIIVVTTAGLLLIPWRWHHEFGKWAIPLATRQLKLVALGSFALGVAVLYAALAP